MSYKIYTWMYFQFKDKHSFKGRKGEANRMIDKYPQRIPIICENYGKNIPALGKTMFSPLRHGS